MTRTGSDSRARPIKVVIAKMGMDSHFRGAIMVARYLVERGMEVIYLGNQLPEAIAEAAVQEDADVVGLSSLSGNHLIMAPRVLSALRERGLSDVLVVLGGTIPPHDHPTMLGEGVAAIFTAGSSLEDIARLIKSQATSRATSPEHSGDS